MRRLLVALLGSLAITGCGSVIIEPSETSTDTGTTSATTGTTTATSTTGTTTPTGTTSTTVTTTSTDTGTITLPGCDDPEVFINVQIGSDALFFGQGANPIGYMVKGGGAPPPDPPGVEYDHLIVQAGIDELDSPSITLSGFTPGEWAGGFPGPSSQADISFFDGSLVYWEMSTSTMQVDELGPEGGIIMGFFEGLVDASPSVQDVPISGQFRVCRTPDVFAP